MCVLMYICISYYTTIDAFWLKASLKYLLKIINILYYLPMILKVWSAN